MFKLLVISLQKDRTLIE